MDVSSSIRRAPRGTGRRYPPCSRRIQLPLLRGDGTASVPSPRGRFSLPPCTAHSLLARQKRMGGAFHAAKRRNPAVIHRRPAAEKASPVCNTGIPSEFQNLFKTLSVFFKFRGLYCKQENSSGMKRNAPFGKFKIRANPFHNSDTFCCYAP